MISTNHSIEDLIRKNKMRERIFNLIMLLSRLNIESALKIESWDMNEFVNRQETIHQDPLKFLKAGALG
jgi:hypothetical protein